MFQDDVIALQDHQRLPMQGLRARLGPLGHRKAQLSAIGGHLGPKGDRHSAGAPIVGSCRGSDCLLFLKGPRQPLPTLSPRKRDGRLQK